MTRCGLFGVGCVWFIPPGGHVVVYSVLIVCGCACRCRHCQELAPVWDQLANKCADSTSGPRIAKVYDK